MPEVIGGVFLALQLCALDTAEVPPRFRPIDRAIYLRLDVITAVEAYPRYAGEQCVRICGASGKCVYVQADVVELLDELSRSHP